MNEIGRELKVHELKPPVVVVLEKPGRPMATMWVMAVLPHCVVFEAREVGITFIATREGPDLNQIGDDTHRMRMYEYLGTI